MTDDGPIKALNVALLDDVGHDQAVRLKRLIKDARGRRGIIKIALKGAVECLAIFVIFLVACWLLDVSGLCPDGAFNNIPLMYFLIFCVSVPLLLALGYDLHLAELYNILDDKIEGGR